MALLSTASAVQMNEFRQSQTVLTEENRYLDSHGQVINLAEEPHKYATFELTKIKKSNKPRPAGKTVMMYEAKHPDHCKVTDDGTKQLLAQ